MAFIEQVKEKFDEKVEKFKRDRAESSAFKENEQRDLQKYSKQKMVDAKKVRQQKLFEERKRAIDRKAEYISKSPERSQQRREETKALFKKAGTNIVASVKTAYAREQSRPQQSKNQSMFGGGGFGNPMAEFERPMKGKRHDPMAEFRGSGRGFGNPMAEFTGKRKKVSGMGYNPMAEFMPRKGKAKQQKAYNPFGNNFRI